MSNNIIYSAGVIGVEAYKIEIEVDILKGGGKEFNILGFQGYEVKESRERILTSILNSGVDLNTSKMTINLYPYYGKKSSFSFDLPISVAILKAHGVIELSSKFINETLIMGGLSLEGKIRPIKGILPIAFAASKLGIKRLIVPKLNALEASVIQNVEIIGVDSLDQLIKYINEEIKLSPVSYKPLSLKNEFEIDYKDVKGHHQAKRAFQIAAAGWHNIIMVGSPGSGKTMLSKRLPTIMPPMSNEDIIETSKIYSISNKLDNNELIVQRPFRDPHHSATLVGLIGGGQYVEPGEISLAHNGILFMDEFAEFKRSALESLRQPLENQTVSISRANQNITYPASFLLVAALNPCPCGYSGDLSKKCTCNNLQVSNYFDKISGPLLDRLDLQLTLNSVNFDTIQNETESLSSEDMRNGVLRAIEFRKKRSAIFNGLMSVKDIDNHCTLTEGAKYILKLAFEKLKMSSRSYHKILKISRTIADLDQCHTIDIKHIKEALMYRSLDKKFSE